MEKEEEEEKKKDERRRTEDSLGVVCTLIYVAAYISAKGGKDEWRRRTERKGRKGSNRTERNANCSGSGRGKKTAKQLEERRRPHFMLPGIGSL